MQWYVFLSFTESQRPSTMTMQSGTHGVEFGANTLPPFVQNQLDGVANAIPVRRNVL
jgi:hypothetical protein